MLIHIYTPRKSTTDRKFRVCDEVACTKMAEDATVKDFTFRGKSGTLFALDPRELQSFTGSGGARLRGLLPDDRRDRLRQVRSKTLRESTAARRVKISSLVSCRFSFRCRPSKSRRSRRRPKRARHRALVVRRPQSFPRLKLLSHRAPEQNESAAFVVPWDRSWEHYRGDQWPLAHLHLAPIRHLVFPLLVIVLSCRCTPPLFLFFII